MDFVSNWSTLPVGSRIDIYRQDSGGQWHAVQEGVEVRLADDSFIRVRPGEDLGMATYHHGHGWEITRRIQ